MKKSENRDEQDKPQPGTGRREDTMARQAGTPPTLAVTEPGPRASSLSAHEGGH
jgi:hypothetical protein